MLERKLFGSKSLALMALAGALALGSSCSKNYEVEVKYGTTDENGQVSFTDSQSNDEPVDITVKNRDDEPVSDATVVFYDGNHFETFFTTHPDYDNSGLDIFPHNSSHNLAIYTGAQWDITATAKSDERDVFKATENWSEWQRQVAYDDQQSRGDGEYATYEGCYLIDDYIEDRNKIAAVLDFTNIFPGVATFRSKLDSFAETYRDVVNAVSSFFTGENIYAGDLESECKAIMIISNKHDSAQNISGELWTQICLGEDEFNTNGEDKCGDYLDNDCDNLIDEGCNNSSENNGNDEDNGENNNEGNNGGGICSGNDLLCDDFEDQLSSQWSDSIDPTEIETNNGYVEVTAISTLAAKPIEGNYDNSFYLLTTFNPTSWFQIYAGNSQNTIMLGKYDGETFALCKRNDESIVNSQNISSFDSNQHELEFQVNEGSATIIVDDSVIFSDNSCFESSGEKEFYIGIFNGGEETKLKSDYVIFNDE